MEKEMQVSENVLTMSKNIVFFGEELVDSKMSVVLEYNGHLEDLQGQAELSGFTLTKVDVDEIELTGPEIEDLHTYLLHKHNSED